MMASPQRITSLAVKYYHAGLQDCLMLIQQGIDRGLSLQDSYDSAKKVIEETVKEGR